MVTADPLTLSLLCGCDGRIVNMFTAKVASICRKFTKNMVAHEAVNMFTIRA